MVSSLTSEVIHQATMNCKNWIRISRTLSADTHKMRQTTDEGAHASGKAVHYTTQAGGAQWALRPDEKWNETCVRSKFCWTNNNQNNFVERERPNIALMAIFISGCVMHWISSSLEWPATGLVIIFVWIARSLFTINGTGSCRSIAV